MKRPAAADAVRAIAFPHAPLALAGREPVAKGQDRFVYFSEDFPDLLFKAPQPLSTALRLAPGEKVSLTIADLANFRRLTLKIAPGTLHRPFHKEMSCYLRTRLRGAETAELPISNLFGFCDSDIGPVMAVERVALPGEMLGATLRRIISEGQFDPEKLALLNQFTDRMFRYNVIAGDMTAANIVFGQRDGVAQFVLIDGFGDIHAIPIRSLSWRLNRIALVRSFQKLARRNGLHFDDNRLAFNLP